MILEIMFFNFFNYNFNFFNILLINLFILILVKKGNLFIIGVFILLDICVV